MTTRPTIRRPSVRSLIYVLPLLAKSFTVDFFVLLPVLYAQKMIGSVQIGFLGSISIAFLVAGALVVSNWLHRWSSRSVLLLGSWLSLASVLLLAGGIISRQLWLLYIAYSLAGLLVGFSISATNALVAAYTDRGNRFATLARMSMLGDLNRIAFPLVVAAALAVSGLNGATCVMGAMAVFFILASVALPPDTGGRAPAAGSLPAEQLRRNHLFQFFLSMEFFDSFASSQLFVFVPILFIAKGHSLKSSLVLQTAIFLGYLAGRWIMSRVASKLSGVTAVALAEGGMVVTIVLLLLAGNLVALYALTFLLGVFARGTSPVIKGLAFDSLHEEHMKRGSALHVVAGDSGSALGQLSFGILLATFGVKAPFLAAATVAAVIALSCIPWMRSSGVPLQNA
jgi:FSR family fosmidomycin resistance protein-like MFS transporter